MRPRRPQPCPGVAAVDRSAVGRPRSLLRPRPAEDQQWEPEDGDIVVSERTGWYGGFEKANTFFFEHAWKPVPGHPAEVATCDVCGLNRWSDEHMNAASEPSTVGERRSCA